MDSERIHILLVEDSETHATIIREALESGHTPVKLTVAQSLAEAHACLRESFPHLAIIDLFLPDGKGVELLPADKEEPAYPVVIMSSHGDEHAAVEAMKAGAVDYVVKSAATLAGMPRMVERVLREWRLITDRKLAEEQLRAAHRQMQDIIEFLPDATFVIDRENKVVAWNRAIEEMTGISKEEMIGQGDYAYACAFYGGPRPMLIDLLDKPDPAIEAQYNLLERQGWSIYAEGFVPSLYNGKGAYLWGKASPLLDQEGNWAGAIESLRDSTERKQAEEDLKKANRELDAFVYTVSHDLRTPLTPIIGYADFLRERCRNRLNEQELDCLAEISASGERMMAMMEDLLTLAKVGQVERPAEPLDTGKVVNEAVCGLAWQITQAGVSVDVGALPTLRIPKTLLAQLFDNLISNAIRYAGREGSPIKVGGERSGDLVRFYVRDHGPGIPQEERSRIFEVFYRGTTGKRSPGTGVGLATVQKIARLYGGRAWVEETPGGGATFWVEMVGAPTAAENKEDTL